MACQFERAAFESGKLELHKAPDNASIRTYSKKMVSQLNRELTKITRNLSGIREMNRLPDAMVIIDPKREEIAIKEAQRNIDRILTCPVKPRRA